MGSANQITSATDTIRLNLAPMPLISIITAAHNARLDFLQELWQSILTSAPESWDFEWCLQEDGEAHDLKDNLPDDPRIRYATNNLYVGAAATRNVALSRATGEWFVNMDYDDFYTSSGLTLLTRLIEEFPKSTWIAGRAHDYDDDTQQAIEFPNYFPDGAIGAEQFMQVWDESGLLFPYVPGGAGMRKELALALGGYTASPLAEDTSLFAAAAQLGSGAYTTEAVFHYRRWSGQTSAFPRALGWNRFEHQRIAAIRAVGLKIQH